MISENITFLKQQFPNIYSILNNKADNVENSVIELLDSKSGSSTIQVLVDGRSQLIHSKYDPKKEAQRLIDQLSNEVKNYEHVLFYGVGLGYHIEEFMNRYPEYSFSMYEPYVEIFKQYLNKKNINELPTHRLKNIFIERSCEERKRFLESLTHNIQERILLIVLPSYQQIFNKKFQQFSEDFKAAVNSKRHSNYVDNLFSARWTLNSLINFPKTIQTPNILQNDFKSCFKDKPLIIVSAGPSLEDDYENLRYIKENKLAYIFAVGSANRALIAQNIMPDAVCTYDPQGHNYNVFASMIERGITSVPMIYGTSVGFETLDMYRGPKLHMFTSQDTVSPYYLKNKDGSHLDFIDDSPTIAAVTFQLAAKLGCNPIIFSGQNLAFKNDQFYSKDVEYKETSRSIKVKEEDREKVLLVEDVYGNQVETTPSFNKMRDYIEFLLKRFSNVEVINTTKGGAAIAGSVFKPLEELLEERLVSSVVDENWYSSVENQYDTSYTKEQIKKMERSIIKFREIYHDIFSLFEDMNKHILERKTNKLSRDMLSFDKLIKKFIVNESYLCYVQPVNRSQFQALSIRAANIRKQTNEIEKAKLIIDSYSLFLERCKQTLEKIAGSIYKIHYEIRGTLERQSYRFYPSDCGAFHYVGMWKKENHSAGKTITYPVKQMVTNEPSICSFKFTGTSLKILGSKRGGGSNHIEILIDGHSEKISAKNIGIDKLEISNINQILFEKHHLVDKEHLVEIKVFDNCRFMFTGVEIGENERLYHIHEVTNIEQLRIGKRIRCHYKAMYNRVGEFSGLGKQTAAFIPPESTAYPEGDFYFIMVDNSNGEHKLVADRNIQSCISWSSLEGRNLIKGTEIKIDNINGRMRIMSGGISTSNANLSYELDCTKVAHGRYGAFPASNEWDGYIFNEGCWNTIIHSWCIEVPIEDLIKYGGIISSDDDRVIRGGGGPQDSTFKHFNFVNKDLCISQVGFRPIIEMKNGEK